MLPLVRTIGGGSKVLPVSRVWCPLAAPDQRDVAQREPGRTCQPAERDVLDPREDLPLEGGEVGELAVLLVPFAGFVFALNVRLGSACGRSFAVRRVVAVLFGILDRA